MKSNLLKSLALGFIALSLWSCKKEETRAVATNGNGGTLKASATAVVLDKSMLTNNVITFDVTKANFGYAAAVTNTIQLAPKGTNFAADKVKEALLDANVTSKSYTGLDFNNLLLSLNLPTTANSDVEIRVKSSISNSVSAVYSNVVTISAKPFPLTSWIYVPGNYQGWNPASADSLVSISGNGVYSGIIKFDGGNFKITPAKKWDIAYGTAGGNKISTTGGDISSISAGYKLVTVDLNANTIEIADAKVWSLIGDATPNGWGGDTDLKPLNDGKNTWKLTTPLTAGEFKFRYNHDWGTNLGGPATALTLGGGNIANTVAGNYTITLTVATDPLEVTKVTGGSYTIVKN
ncbi:SusE domain-containing protein [Pedobacter sandarakinus]|uniref:SusE domain-containing protein n=1 Tax=Pedobacter sandarakinus TaxID=353156 RepID=UPI002248362B|nr:SusE domain-containing protein [Pedobacter sandarakinus]MCX2573161.1 SusE domain-containing protein [Pedobacter sandarakinus]